MEIWVGTYIGLLEYCLVPLEIEVNKRLLMLESGI